MGGDFFVAMAFGLGACSVLSVAVGLEVSSLAVAK
jgi:hypothetical protein